MANLLARCLSRVERVAGIGNVTTIFYGFRNSDPLPSLVLSPGVIIEKLSSENIDTLSEVWPVKQNEMRQRLAHGDLCYAGFLDGRIASYCWAQLSGTHHFAQANVDLVLKPEDVVLYHARTAGWARGNGIYPCLLVRMMKDQFLAGRMHAIGYTTLTNIPSQRGILRAGFHEEYRVRSFCIGQHYFKL